MAVVFKLCEVFKLSTPKRCCLLPGRRRRSPSSSPRPVHPRVFKREDHSEEIHVTDTVYRVDDFAPIDELERCDVYVFQRSSADQRIRFVSASGPNAELYGLRVAGGTLAGEPLESLPSSVRRLKTQLIEDTLGGHHLLLTYVARSGSRVISTHPILDHQGKVIGGTLVARPLPNGVLDVKAFRVGGSEARRCGEHAGTEHRRQRGRDKSGS